MILRLSQEQRGLVYLLSVFVLCALSARASASDPGVIEAAKKEGGEIEAYVTLRTDTAQIIWKLFAARYPFLKVKQYKADSDKMLHRLVTEYRAKRYLVDVLNFGRYFGK